MTRFHGQRDESEELGLRPADPRRPKKTRSVPWDRSKRRRAWGGWHRRVSTRRYRLPAGAWTINELDGGRDAPLDEHGLRVWHVILAAVVVLGVALVLVAWLS